MTGQHQTMQDVDHTHPHTDSVFGTVFTRGPAVAADGGAQSSGRRATSESGGGRDTDETETMADVDHTAADEGVDRAFERGTEGRTDTV